MREQVEMLGGHVVCAPEHVSVLVGARPHSKFSGADAVVLQDDAFRVGVRASDQVLPVCHEGVNRSQVLHVLLRGIKRALTGDTSGPGVFSPHGAESGYDPHVGFEHLDMESVFEYTHGVVLGPESEGEWIHKVFVDVFGRARYPRFGSQLAPEGTSTLLNLDPTEFGSTGFDRLERDRKSFRTYFDNHFWSRQVPRLSSNLVMEPKGLPEPVGVPPDSDPRIIFFCFMRASTIAMRRLVQVCKYHDTDLRNVYIVALPHGDPTTGAGGREEVESASKHRGRPVTREELTAEAYEALLATFAKVAIGVRVDPFFDAAVPSSDLVGGSDDNPGGMGGSSERADKDALHMELDTDGADGDANPGEHENPVPSPPPRVDSAADADTNPGEESGTGTGAYADDEGDPVVVTRGDSAGNPGTVMRP